MDLAGGDNFVFMGTSQLLSVPFSLFSDNGVPDGQNPGDMLYWNGTQWLKVNAGLNGQVLTFNDGMPVWGGVQLPVINTNLITNINAFTAYGGGNIASDGGSPVTVRGLCWNSAPNPTTANFKTTNGSGAGSFNANLNALSASTLYYVRAYATNSAGTSYGNEVTFTTLGGSITLTTTAITAITVNSATSGGNITNNGGAAVTMRGVCWNTSPFPTTANNKTTNGSGNGVFVSELTGLLPDTLYYVRSYATNAVGTYYGNEVSFTTISDFYCGSTITINHLAGIVSPVDKTVTYGTITNIPGETTKCWITSNLGADHQATSVDDATEASAGWYWQFNRKQGYKHDGTTRTPNTTWVNGISETYDWTIANDPCSLELGTGWRIPTNTEWTNVDASGNWIDWNGPWNSGLKMHFAGALDFSDGGLLGCGLYGYYWSSTHYNATGGWTLIFGGGYGYSQMGVSAMASGFSLRCLRD